jgi:dopamine beta-monooxygenase
MTMMVSPIVPLLLVLTRHSTQVQALQRYIYQIPNGGSVPNPGPQGGVWAGVGHAAAAGGGDRNVFGNDFSANNHEWTQELCQTDSDGDGRSNGEELGDPLCEWIAGGPDPLRPALSHPGIVDDPKNITTAINACETYVASEDEIVVDIQFSSPSDVDETQTHYICEQKVIDVPAKQVLHLVKHSIILDNTNLLHHMFVFLCDNGDESSNGDKVGEGQFKCSGTETGCKRIAGWAVGPSDSCLPSNVGFEYDFSNSDNITIMIEAHYDNSAGVPQTDQSGMRLHFTSTLRPVKAGNLMLGVPVINKDFSLPPLQESYELTSACPMQVTQLLTHPVYAFSFAPHMHLFGRKLVTDHYRCGLKIGEIGRIDAYEFDNQQAYQLAQPVKILPGDAFVTTCTFDTTNSNVTIVGGEATTDEMCLSFINYYPFAGTETNPTFFGNCFSFENGVKTKTGIDNSMRFAVGDRSQQVLLREFDSDPTTSFAPCCFANTCDEQYRVTVGGACAADEDCLDALTCSTGLCVEGATIEPPTVAPNPVGSTSSAGKRVPISAAAGVMSLMAFALNV